MGQPGGDDADLDRIGQEEIEGRTGAGETAPPPDMPPAGPHDKPFLIDPDATAGTGSLPAPTPGDEVDPGTG